MVMNAAATLRETRRRAGLTLRALAARAGTSHATLSAYEHGHKVPTVDTLSRIVQAAGMELLVEARPRVGGPDLEGRGQELVEVLELAAQFPARHQRSLPYPRFGAA
jgi:transcriptional regulator with XRE-family HTH domain